MDTHAKSGIPYLSAAAYIVPINQLLRPLIDDIVSIP